MKSFWKTFVLILFAWVGGLTASFAQNSSNDNVYAVGTGENCDPRLKVVFHMEGEDSTVIYITEADQQSALFDAVVYNPWNGTTTSGVSFYGWTTEDDYDASDIASAKTIAQVRNDLKNITISTHSTHEVHYYALLFKHYTVTYLDNNNVALGAYEVSYKYDVDNPNPEETYTVNMGYTPIDDEHAFLGWLVQQGSDKIQGYTAGKLYENGTSITITGDVIFSVHAPEGYWLVFNENGKGGTYNAPQFVNRGEVTQNDLLTMTRNGYTFGGWYTDAACTAGNEFSFGGTLSETTTIYAKWNPIETANYTIIIWKQNIEGDGYDYEDLISLSGNVNTTIDKVTVREGTLSTTYKYVYNNEVFEFSWDEPDPYDNDVYESNKKTVSGYEISYRPRTSNSNIYYVIKIGDQWMKIGEYRENDPQYDPSDNKFYKASAILTDVTYGNNAYARINGRDYQYTGFHLDRYDQNVTITPEGNAVVNVYYDRNEHTLQFQVLDDIYTPTTSNNGTQYGLVDGQYVELTRHGRGNNRSPYYWTYNDGWISEGPTYTGTRYTRSRDWQTIKTITALYEQPIGNNFPIVGTNGVTYNNGERWEPQNSLTYHQVLVYIDVMPNEDITFRLNTSNFGMKHLYYYVEALDGETSDEIYKGKNFVLYHQTDAKYGMFTEREDYLDLSGFDKGDKNGNNYSPRAENAYGYNVSQIWENSNAVSIWCYYTRKKYSINFMDGAYVDGNGSPISELDEGQLHEEPDIPYQTILTSYNIGETDYYIPTAPDGYEFEGWYIDKACIHAYTFDKMPQGGITVYAKWHQIQYRVFLHPNAGTDASLDWGSDDQEMNFRISYGGQISAPEGKRTQYSFVGWYRDSSFSASSLFNKNIILNNTTVTTPYDKTTHMTDPMDKFGNGATTNADMDRFWITREFNLYAQWRKKLINANGINLEYNLNGGSGVVTDGNLYADESYAVAQLATSITPPSGKAFAYWVLQKWNKTNNQFDSIGIVYPGASFKVLEENAHIETIDDDHNRYTVELRAVYVDEESAPAPVSITWHNDTDEPSSEQVNHEVDIPEPGEKEGYIFRGWSLSDNTECDPDFLIYNSTDHNFTKAGSSCVVTKVAADIFSAQNTLYAVWIPDVVCPTDYGFIVEDNGSGNGAVEIALPTENCVLSWSENNDDLDITNNVVTGNLPFGETTVTLTATRSSDSKTCPIKIYLIKRTAPCTSNGGNGD